MDGPASMHDQSPVDQLGDASEVVLGGHTGGLRLTVLDQYIRNIAAMKDDQLELFVDDWIARKKAFYVETEVWAGPGDKGRDVVGYLTTQRLDGAWHLFQCKQLKSTLRLPDAIKELGKIFHHVAQGHYGLPEAYYFVAPRGVARPVQELVASPTKFKAAMLEKWDEYCASRLVENDLVPLSPKIASLIQKFNFGQVHTLDVRRMLKDEHILSVLVKWFNHDPGAAPKGTTPIEIDDEELPYLRQLFDAYGEKAGTTFADMTMVLEHGIHGEHLRRQRTRYYDAASFKRYYRDNTPADYLDTLEDEVFHGIIEVHERSYPDTLTRIDEVMSRAANVQPSGVLARYARVPVRQGLCHHFANAGLLWKR